MDWKNQFSPLDVTTSDTLPDLMLSYLGSWSAINMIGPDKKSYLQGQVTCNVVTLTNEQSTLGAHCDAKGKVWSVFRLFHHNDGYALFQPASAIDVELAELKKYAIFSKVEITASQDVALGVMGNEAQNWVDSQTNSRADVRPITGGSAVKISEKRWLLLVNQDQAEIIINEFSSSKVTEATWTRFDIEEALPVVTAQVQNEYIPQALNLQAIGGICFTKGCYTGQETVARAKYRGINKRMMAVVKGNLAEELPSAEPIVLERSVGENWRTAGELLTHYTFKDNVAIGLVVLPNDLEDGTQLRLAIQPDTRWTIEPLPYSLADE